MVDIPRQIDTAYRDAIDNIRFSKRQQWVYTNYAIASYAAAFVLAKQAPFNSGIGRFALTVLVLAVMAYSCYVILSLQKSLKKFRDRLTWIYIRHLTIEECEGLRLSRKPKPLWHEPGFPVGLMMASIIAAAIVLAALWIG